MYHIDYEAQYKMTTEYVEDTFKNFPGIRKYWICLPIKASCAVSMFQDHWVPWEKSKKNLWVRSIPANKFVINEDNSDLDFDYNIRDYEFQVKFSNWFSKKHGKTAVLVGIRSDESLNRQAAITSFRRNRFYKSKKYSKFISKDTYNFYPIYDWKAEDVWTANYKFNFSYNKIYDLYHQAGLRLHQMRVASPFHDCGTSYLKLYKAIDPNTWARMIGRVNGVNFAAIYGGTKMLGWKKVALPKDHTWESYFYFLLSTLPENVKDNYLCKFQTSLKFWKEKGGALRNSTIKDLSEKGVKFEISKQPNTRGYSDKKLVMFKQYLDDIDIHDFKAIPTYKRMCICIMKNDHACKYMGFAPTKKEKERRAKAIEMVKNL